MTIRMDTWSVNSENSKIETGKGRARRRFAINIWNIDFADKALPHGRATAPECRPFLTVGLLPRICRPAFMIGATAQLGEMRVRDVCGGMR